MDRTKITNITSRRRAVGRPEKDIDSMDGSLAQFGIDLKHVRHRAGWPIYEEMSEKTGVALGALSQAALGESCPSWRTLVAYLEYCGEDPEVWRPRWEMLASPAQRLQAGFPVRADQRRAVQIMRPENIRTVAEFALGLRHLRALQGQPPLKVIARTTGHGISTISGLLNCKDGKLPTFDLTMAYLKTFELGTAELKAWRSAWSELKAMAETSSATG